MGDSERWVKDELLRSRIHGHFLQVTTELAKRQQHWVSADCNHVVQIGDSEPWAVNHVLFLCFSRLLLSPTSLTSHSGTIALTLSQAYLNIVVQISTAAIMSTGPISHHKRRRSAGQEGAIPALQVRNEGFTVLASPDAATLE